MAATRTPGITIDTDGNYFVDKHHLGERNCVRLGHTAIEQAEARLQREISSGQSAAYEFNTGTTKNSTIWNLSLSALSGPAAFRRIDRSRRTCCCPT